MFKNFKKNEKYLSIAIYSFLVIVSVIALVFIFLNFGKITTFIEGLIGALMSFIYGFVFAYLCNPIYKSLHKYVFKFLDRKKERPKLRKAFSIALAYIIFLSLITLMFFAIIPQIANNISSLGENISKYVENISGFLNSSLDKLSGLIPALDAEAIIEKVMGFFSFEGDGIFANIVNYILQNVINIGSAVVSQVFAIVVGVILSIYFLIYKDSLVSRLKRLLCAIFKKESYEKIIGFGRYTDKTFGRYLMGAILDSLLVGLVVFVILAILKFPFALLIGVIVGVTNIIPFFGPFLGAIPSAILILIDTGDIWKVLLFVIIIVVVQQIDGNIIAPHIHGSATGLTPIGVILSVTVCSHLFGFVGMLIGVPLSAVISYLVTCLIEKNLKKKKLPVNVDCYRAKDIYSDESFLKAKGAMEAQERVEYHEAVEKVIAENKIAEEVIHQVEERVIDEIINNAAEEIITKAEAEVVAESNNENQ